MTPDDPAVGLEPGQGYLFDTADRIERQRLEAQAATWDAFTFGNLEDVGVAQDWRCLEIGGGVGSVASWLADRVGERGRVVVTDLETRWLEPLAAVAPNVEVRRHDVTADPLDDASYDLVHVRLVLSHLPGRDTVVGKLAAALRPGGWLVVEDYDFATFTLADPPNPTWTKVSDAARTVLGGSGTDVGYGRKLPGALRSAGLADVRAEGRVILQRPPEAAAALVPIFSHMRTPIVERHLASPAELDWVMAELDDPDSELSIYWPTLVSARGRRHRP